MSGRHGAHDIGRFRSHTGGGLSELATGRFVVERILCPVDFSETSRVALRYAVALARWYGAEVRTLHVVDVTLAAGPAELAWDYNRAARMEERVDLRDRLRDFLEPVEGVATEIEVREGIATEQILDQAAASQADVIVMGTRGPGRLKRLVLGSTAQRVLRSASCPVLTVPPHAERTPPADRVLFSRILCPVNFSDHSLRALELALSLAQEVDGRLTLLHILDQLLAAAAAARMGRDAEIGYTFPQLERDTRDELRQLIPDDAWAWCNPEESIVVADAPVRAIVKAAHDTRADLLVMSLRRRGGIDRMLFGSTTESVVRESRCPVLTVCAA